MWEENLVEKEIKVDLISKGRVAGRGNEAWRREIKVERWILEVSRKRET